MMRRRNLLITITMVLLILTAISLTGLAQDKSPTRWQYDFHSYYQKYPIPEFDQSNSLVLLETDFDVFPAWGGWTRKDMTGANETYWQVSSYNAANLGGPGNKAWWCGQIFADDCGTGDFNGYGNYWDTRLLWTGAFSDRELPHSITVNADLNLDTETGNDKLTLEYFGDSGWETVATYSGTLVNEQVSVTFPTMPGEIQYDLEIMWRFHSDGATSDEDCDGPTVGAAQIDNIEIIRDGVQLSFEDNEDPLDNEWTEDWANCGNFAALQSDLFDWDFSRSNSSPQVVFIDDGSVVPGTGGSLCLTWCYGDNGYIVNSTGGLCGPEYGIHVEIWSPVVPIDAVPYDPLSIHLRFEAYRHEPLARESAGIFYYWRVRSYDTGGDPLGPWAHSPYFYGEPAYVDHHQDLTPYIEPGAPNFQVALGMVDLSNNWGWGNGYDSTPAPYFDNISLIASQAGGVVLEAEEPGLAQDNFPTHGFIDYGNLASNHIRIDAARNIAPVAHLMNQPQDSLLCRAVSLGAPLTGPPELFYTVGTNPLFDPYRLPPTGSVVGVPIEYSDNEYAFYLPDNGLMYPGDVMHYYITAANLDGASAHIPADTSGYGVFPGSAAYVHLKYPSKYTMRGLPSMKSAEPGDQPKILFWNDFGRRGDEAKWIYALENLCIELGEDYDLYYTNQPSSGLGNGLGGRATPISLAGYETILYSCGDLGAFTLSNGDFVTDAGFDLEVLDQWIQFGYKNLLLTGSKLYFDLLHNVGVSGEAFSSNWLGVELVHRGIRPSIDGQGMPGVTAIPGNPVFQSFTDWAVGPGPTGNPLTWINGIETNPGAVRCAEFTDPAGNSGAYSYAAATNYERPDFQYKNVCLPYDLMDIVYPTSKSAAARTEVLEEILLYFGHPTGSGPCNMPDPLLCEAWRKYPGIPVSVFTLPNGGGNPLNNSFVYPNSPSEIEYIDETITLVVRNGEGHTIPFYPAEDMWLKTSLGGLTICRPGGTAADGPTDESGQTTFSKAYFGGGYTEFDGSERLQVMVNNEEVPDTDFLIYFNSSDITSDCKVALQDLSIFAQDYLGEYQYRSDLAADRILNLIDVAMFSASYGIVESSELGKDQNREGQAAKYDLGGRLGLYADPEGNRHRLDVEPNTSFDLYLAVTGGVSGSGIRGWECRVEVPDNVVVQEWELRGKTLNLREAPEFIVGLAEAVPVSETTVLAVARCVVLDDSPAWFRLHPSGVSSLNPPRPAITLGDNENITDLAGLKIAADQSDGPVFGVNVGDDVPGQGELPSRYSLHPNSPNPFNPQTEIKFDLPHDGPVALKIYGLDGRCVATLVSENRTRGSHVVVWNGVDDGGRAVASGVYLCRMEAGSFVQTMRMVLLK